MSLKGKIGSIYLSSVLQLLCNDKKTGVLQVWNAENEVKIYLYEGTIVYAKSSQKKHRLGYLLRSEGIISAEELRKCLRLAQEKKQTLGKVMVEKGIISIVDFAKFMCQKVRHTLYDLFMWEKGDFEYKETKLNLDGHIVTNLNTMELILEASRRADEMLEQKKKSPGDKQASELSEKAKEDSTINFIPNIPNE